MPPSILEVLRGAVETQERCLAHLARHQLAHLNAAVDKLLRHAKPVTLALHTRQFRLTRLLQVLEELIEVESQLLTWYAGLDSHDPGENDMHNEVHEVIACIHKTSNELSRGWGESKEAGSSSRLEQRIRLLHKAIEDMLLAVKGLVQYLKQYDLLPVPAPMTESVKYYGDGFVRTEEATLTALVQHIHRAKARKDNYGLLDTPKINLLLMSLPQKYNAD